MEANDRERAQPERRSESESNRAGYESQRLAPIAVLTNLSRMCVLRTCVSRPPRSATAMSAGNIDEALEKQMQLVYTDWHGNCAWLPGVKTLLNLLKITVKSQN